jgi:hypothetical protein
MKRTLDQFIEFTGMNTRTQTAFGDRCRQLEWVPFSPDVNAEVDSTDVWGFNPEVIKANGPNIPLLTGSIEYQSFDKAAQAAGLSSGSGLQNIHFTDGTLSRAARLEESIKVAEGELWWIFQSVDRSVESAIEQVDNEIGDGHGHRVLKLILLLAPLLAFVLYTAIVVMASPSRPVRGDAKRI